MVIYTKITVDGVQLNADNMKVDLSTGDNNSSSTFTAELNNKCGYTLDQFAIGDEVKIYAHEDVNPPTQCIFTGILEKIDMIGQATEDRISISGRDYSAKLMDALIQPEVYNNTEAGSIAKQLVLRYCDDVTTGGMGTTTTMIAHISFVNISVYDALKQLGELSGFYFYVDINKQVNFIQKSVTSSGVTLNNTNIIQSDFAQTTREIYNSCYVYGNKILTNWYNEFTGDGAGSEFILDYRPHNTRVEKDGVLQKGGIFEFDVTPSGVNYLVDFDQKKIIFPSGTNCGENMPGAGVLVAVSYDRSSPLIKYAEDTTSISVYGKKTKIISDSNITEKQEAADLAAYTVEEYASPRLEGNISIKGVYNLVPGQTIAVVLARENINEVFEMVSVEYDLNPSAILTEQVFTIRVSKKILDLSDTLKQMMMDIRKLQLRDTTESATRLETDTATFDLQDHWIAYKRTIGNSFYLGHPVNGLLGSPSVIVLGSSTASAWTMQGSGGDY